MVLARTGLFPVAVCVFVVLVGALGCERRERAPGEPAPAPAEPSAKPVGASEPAEPAEHSETALRPAPLAKPLVPDALRGGPLDELAFVPADIQALIRVDLAAVGSRSDKPVESLKTLDFLLHAQQPAAWQILHEAGITVGKEIAGLYLILAGGPESVLVVGVGAFDAARLGIGLRRAGAVVEPAPAPRGQTATLFTWKKPSGAALGALEQSGILGDTAVGLGDHFLVFGPPALVRRALSSRAGLEPDVRTTALASELLAVDATATVWGVGSDSAWLPGMRRGHFQAALASPGPDIDGVFTLRAEFGSRDQAVAFGDRLKSLLATIALLGERSPLGAGFAKLKNGATVKLDDTIVIASAAL